MRYEKPKRTTPKEPPAEVQELIDPGTEAGTPKPTKKAATRRGSRSSGPNGSSKGPGKNASAG